MDVRTRVACYAWVERDGAVLLSRWRGLTLPDGRVARPSWTLVGGGMELGESPEQTAIREVHEESGYAVRLTGVLTTDAWSGLDDHHPGSDLTYQAVRIVFTGEVVGGELSVEVDGSSDDVRWVPLTELADLPCAGIVDAAWRAAGGPGLPAASVTSGPVDESVVTRVRALLDERRGDAALRGAAPAGVTVVAVDGPSGSGKTVLARAIARDLGGTLVQMDDLFPGWDGLARASGLLTEQVLEPLSRGEAAAYRRWDWHADDWAPEPVPVEVGPGGVLVVEGCGSSVGPAATHAAVRVWVEAEDELRMRRGIARDGEAFRPHWERWAVQEAELFAADGTRGRADLVVDTTPVPSSRASVP
ncbi:NUDIX domain-containing protein [Serinicoccus kebangsaanensis]|uniref:NUDIX domain-containing protein n=1 Tax=Serinicoccus kebangsaanensis TaxID=2602069 RepID=UPI00124BE5AB|nr:NUDIX domain-containing protein [Serinicoccus kebangsaanensis]